MKTSRQDERGKRVRGFEAQVQGPRRRGFPERSGKTLTLWGTQKRRNFAISLKANQIGDRYY